MNPNPDPQWEAELGERLKRLPNLCAPSAFAPRVMATLRARANKTWWQRSWFEWPRAFQAASLILPLLILAGSGSVEHTAWSLAGQAWDEATFPALWSQSSSLWCAGAGMFADARNTLQSWGGHLWAIVAVVTALYLACIGTGIACFRIATNKI